MDPVKFREEKCTPTHDGLCQKHDYCVSYSVRSSIDKESTEELCTKYRCLAFSRPIDWDERDTFDTNKQSAIDHEIKIQTLYQLTHGSKSGNRKTNGNGKKRINAIAIAFC